MLIASNISGVFAESTKTLAEDTKLYPVGWFVGDSVLFKGGTEVILNDFGEVIQGKLASSTDFLPVGWRGVVESFNFKSGIHYGDSAKPGHLRFKGNHIISFNNLGEVVSGTLDFEATIYLSFPNKKGIIILKGGTFIKYHDNGVLAEGTLEKEKLLKPSGWTTMANNGQAGFIKFKDGTVIKLNDKAEVIEGTIKEDTKVWLADGNTKIYPAGTVVKFTDTKINMN
jgi:hypothetical protein